jgi:predicted DNA-binding transcriptional regulator YafY
MCKTFSEHLLGKDFFEEATRALEKSQADLAQQNRPTDRHFAAFKAGGIDYTPHQDTIRTLIEAMDGCNICRITYKSILTSRAKTFYIKPLKIFSYKDSVYLHAHLARCPGKPFREPEFNPLLAVHRIKKVEKTERLYEFPKDYDFERVFQHNFGVIQNGTFEVEVAFTGWSARYVAERIWSADQKIIRNNGQTVLSFSASSEPEVVSWVLSFGSEAALLKPKRLQKDIKDTISALARVYKGTEPKAAS